MVTTRKNNNLNGILPCFYITWLNCKVFKITFNYTEHTRLYRPYCPTIEFTICVGKRNDENIGLLIFYCTFIVCPYRLLSARLRHIITHSHSVYRNYKLRVKMKWTCCSLSIINTCRFIGYKSYLQIGRNRRPTKILVGDVVDVFFMSADISATCRRQKFCCRRIVD